MTTKVLIVDDSQPRYTISGTAVYGITAHNSDLQMGELHDTENLLRSIIKAIQKLSRITESL